MLPSDCNCAPAGVPHCLLCHPGIQNQAYGDGYYDSIYIYVSTKATHSCGTNCELDQNA